MTDRTTELQIADGLEVWTGELDRADEIQLAAALATVALQIAKRRGPEYAAAELRSLADTLHAQPRRPN